MNGSSLRSRATSRTAGMNWNPNAPRRALSSGIIGRMRAVVQRVASASVAVAAERVASIGQGLLVLLGVGQGDGEEDVRHIVDKLVHLRVFADEGGQMNRSVRDVQ